MNYSARFNNPNGSQINTHNIRTFQEYLAIVWSLKILNLISQGVIIFEHSVVASIKEVTMSSDS